MSHIPGLLLIVLLALSPLSVLSQGRKPKISNMERLNTAADEDHPCPIADNQQLIFSTTQNGERILYLATRKSPSDPLTRERVMDELTGEGACASSCVTSKDREGWEFLYFATHYHTEKGKLNFDLYKVGRFNVQRPFQGFSAASPVQSVATEADEVAPWVTADGKELYFSRKEEKGWQLMHAQASQPHAFGKPEAVELEVGYHHATLSRTGLTMIVQGPLQPGEARQGLFVSRRTSTTTEWSSPKAIASLNSDEGKIGTCSPSLSADNKYLYFASDRPGGKGGLDLYVMPVAEVEELKK